MIFDRLKNITRSYIHDFMQDDEALERERERLDEEYERIFGQSGQQHTHSQQTSTTPNVEAEHYKTLELPVGASFAEVKASYRELIKKYHPDRHTDPDKHRAALEVTQRLNQAYAYFKQKHK